MEKIRAIRDRIEWFLVYAVIGWLYECIWCVMIDENSEFFNRGFLKGPWLPIYGFAMLIIMFVIRKLKIKRPMLIFLTGAAISTVAELIGSYFLEKILGYFLWDYSEFFMNFEGRIAVKPEVMFGLLVLGGALSVQPKMEYIQERFKDSILHNVIFIAVFGVFVVDLITRFAAL